MNNDRGLRRRGCRRHRSESAGTIGQKDGCNHKMAHCIERHTPCALHEIMAKNKSASNSIFGSTNTAKMIYHSSLKHGKTIKYSDTTRMTTISDKKLIFPNCGHRQRADASPKRFTPILPAQLSNDAQAGPEFKPCTFPSQLRSVACPWQVESATLTVRFKCIATRSARVCSLSRLITVTLRLNGNVTLICCFSIRRKMHSTVWEKS